ncbi:MAG TPA: acyltransferase [Candidatus Krumholzibacteria bacterium]|nr:acyltransferase [Candidatus Krumholzibacteria bacterium]HRX49874.1 acyltransferase [Candidatus Krumholzibacteria bacterium]
MKEIRPLTSLRAFAAFLVFMYHYANLFPPAARGVAHFPGEWIPLRFLWSQGQVGVSMFFVLSGFLITRIYYDSFAEGRASLRLFLIKRVARIWPLFLAFAAIQHGTRLLAGGHMDATWWVTLSMTQGFFEHLRYEGLPTAWSLTIEESFYVLAPALFLLLAGVRAPRRPSPADWARIVMHVAAVTVGLLALGAAGHRLAAAQGWDWQGLLGSRDHVLRATLFGRFPEFAVGVLAAFVHRTGELPRRLGGGRAAWLATGTAAAVLAALAGKAALAGAAGVGAALGTVVLTYAVAVLTGVLILALSVGGSRLHAALGWEPFVYLGRVSYGFYLIQLTVMMDPLLALTDRLGPARLPALFLLTNLACASFYELLESPARAWIVARWGRRD